MNCLATNHAHGDFARTTLHRDVHFPGGRGINTARVHKRRVCRAVHAARQLPRWLYTSYRGRAARRARARPFYAARRGAARTPPARGTSRWRIRTRPRRDPSPPRRVRCQSSVHVVCTRPSSIFLGVLERNENKKTNLSPPPPGADGVAALRSARSAACRLPDVNIVRKNIWYHQRRVVNVPPTAAAEALVSAAATAACTTDVARGRRRFYPTVSAPSHVLAAAAVAAASNIYQGALVVSRRSVIIHSRARVKWTIIIYFYNGIYGRCFFRPSSPLPPYT